MNATNPNPNCQAECPFSIHFSQHDSDDRIEVEQFIRDVFYQAYGARIKRFKPCLMSLRDHDNRLVAVCGFRNATLEPLFMETYLDQPVETVIAERTGSPVRRGDIVEVGNFSVAMPGVARYLIAAIFDQLHATSKQWAVFTVVPAVYNALVNMGLQPIVLGDADKSRLPAEDQADWGSYYAQKPKIMTLQRVDQRNKTRLSGICFPEPAIGTRSKACA